MRDYAAFWEIPDFWKMLTVLALVAAMATLAICFGPTEAPYDDEDPEQSTTPPTPPTQTRKNQ